MSDEMTLRTRLHPLDGYWGSSDVEILDIIDETKGKNTCQ